MAGGVPEKVNGGGKEDMFSVVKIGLFFSSLGSSGSDLRVRSSRPEFPASAESGTDFAASVSLLRSKALRNLPTC